MSEFLRNVPWYDRNAKQVDITYQAGSIEPHSSTVRDSYTVPKSKMGFISSISLEIVRREATTALGKAYGVAVVAGQWVHQVTHWNDTVGHVERAITGFCGILIENQVISLITADGSEGGSLDYILNAVITEFDSFPIEEPPFEVELPPIDVQEPLKPWWQWW